MSIFTILTHLPLTTAIIFSVTFICLVRGEISSSLGKECLNSPEKRVNVILELFPLDKSKFSSNNPDEFIQSLKFYSWESQSPVISAIQNFQDSFDGEIQRFWITNRLFLKSASCASLESLAKIPGVQTVRKEAVASLHSIGEATLADWEISSKVSEASPPWGVTKIGAHEVWNLANKPSQGAGVVVANIDTGVRGSHEALKGNFRGGDFSWLDGTRNSSQGSPTDGHGHGTHTMGSICGGKGIGVAPGAKWMACKGCSPQGCSESALLTCGQWCSCPYSTISGVTVSDCSKRPNIISCSWGSGGKDDEDSRSFYNELTENWKTMGIITFFSLGNSGPSCATTKSPADQGYVISVGATTPTDAPANFSSRGPSPYNNAIKPDISAPGEKILSAWKKNDTSYATISGTSMSCPHAAGMAALLLSKNSQLNYDKMLELMSKYAVKPAGGSHCDPCSTTTSCSSTGSMPYPNNVYGHGRISAIDTYSAI